jgi:hypothetical protein
MKIIFRIISIIYAVVIGVVLIAFSPILLPLSRLGIEPDWLYHTNTKVNIWLASKYLK